MTVNTGDGGQLEPGVLRSVWRYRWLFLVFVLAFAGLGFATKYLQGESSAWTAFAVLVVEDPRASALFDPTAQPQGRYVQNQVVILRSTPVAEKAAETLNASGITPQDILASSEVIASSNSSEVITIVYRADSAVAAIAGANAIADAYQFVRRTEAARNYQTTLERLDEFIETSDARLSELEQEIVARELGTPFENELRKQLDEAVQQLLRLGNRSGVSPAQLESIVLELAAIQGEIDAVQRVLEFEPSSAELDGLRRERENLFGRVASLMQRRDEIEIDSELLGSGVLLSSPAVEATPPAEQNPTRNIILGTVFGMALGAVAAYFLALRRRTFTAATQPAVVLQAPLLTEVPHFKEERVSTLLPVSDAPNSVSAEAFRFILSATQLRFGTPSGGGGHARKGSMKKLPTGTPRRLAFVSASPGDGKSVVTANTALAAAGEGQRVLIVDADVGDQGLSRLLIPLWDSEPTKLTLADGSTIFADVIAGEDDGEDDGAIHLINRDSLGAMGPTRFATEGLPLILSAAQSGQYDLVCVDIPPLLHVAYASTIARGVGDVVVVLRHGSRVSEAEEVKNRLALSDSSTLGYVYNMAPLRPDAGAASNSARAYRESVESQQAERSVSSSP